MDLVDLTCLLVSVLVVHDMTRLKTSEVGGDVRWECTKEYSVVALRSSYNNTLDLEQFNELVHKLIVSLTKLVSIEFTQVINVRSIHV